MVTGVAAGTADISVTKIITGVTRSAAMKATIRAATPSADLVLIADMQRGWQPSVAHLVSGGTVTWTLTGTAPHSITGDGFDSGILDPGATFAEVLDDVKRRDPGIEVIVLTGVDRVGPAVRAAPGAAASLSRTSAAGSTPTGPSTSSPE